MGYGSETVFEFSANTRSSVSDNVPTKTTLSQSQKGRVTEGGGGGYVKGLGFF